MKEDVLEQIVDDYLQMQGYFTTHNVRFHPPRDQQWVSQTDSVPSDIDVVGLHPRRTGAERVMVVSCKSWQSGFAASHILAQLRGGWQAFKERTWLWAIVAQFCVVLMAWYGAFSVLGPVVAKEHLGGPAAWGAITAADALGLIAGGVVSLRVTPRRPMLFVVLAGSLPLAAQSNPEILPTGLDFGYMPSGSSAVQTVSVYNISGGASVTVNSITSNITQLQVVSGTLPIL